jgi:hypothetical protein
MKHGIREKVKRDLHRLWDAVIDEPVPGSFSELIEQLNKKGK